MAKYFSSFLKKILISNKIEKKNHKKFKNPLLLTSFNQTKIHSLCKNTFDILNTHIYF